MPVHALRKRHVSLVQKIAKYFENWLFCKHPLPSEGAMGERYENRCGFSPVLHRFGRLFLESEDKIYACRFKTIIEEIEPQNCHANTCTKVSERAAN